MKNYLSILFAFTILLTSCQTSQPLSESTQPFVPENTPTLLPVPTNTPEPSPTPITLPDTLNQTFSNISIVYRDTFNYVLDNVVPSGWTSEEKYAAWVTSDSQFKIHPTDNGSGSGTVFYFSGERITPNKGVYFTFKYLGAAENFTLGFDAIETDGQRIPFGEENFYSVAMELRDKTPYAYGNKKLSSSNGSFEGNMNLQEDVWYDIALGYDNKDNYIIKIWQPDDPEKQLTYFHTWKDFPTKYYFISWINAKRMLLIDDFTVFKFGNITKE